MADLRAGRCFSWLEGGEQEGSASGRASKALQPPPAEVAAAVDARLEPSPGLADELQQVGLVLGAAGWQRGAGSGRWWDFGPVLPACARPC